MHENEKKKREKKNRIKTRNRSNDIREGSECIGPEEAMKQEWDNWSSEEHEITRSGPVRRVVGGRSPESGRKNDRYEKRYFLQPSSSCTRWEGRSVSVIELSINAFDVIFSFVYDNRLTSGRISTAWMRDACFLPLDLAVSHTFFRLVAVYMRRRYSQYTVHTRTV